MKEIRVYFIYVSFLEDIKFLLFILILFMPTLDNSGCRICSLVFSDKALLFYKSEFCFGLAFFFNFKKNIVLYLIFFFSLEKCFPLI